MAKRADNKISQKAIFICPKCSGDLELRKTMPGGTMNLVCKKSKQLPRKEGWEVNHGNFTDDCGYSILFRERFRLDYR